MWLCFAISASFSLWSCGSPFGKILDAYQGVDLVSKSSHLETNVHPNRIQLNKCILSLERVSILTHFSSQKSSKNHLFCNVCVYIHLYFTVHEYLNCMLTILYLHYQCREAGLPVHPLCCPPSRMQSPIFFLFTVRMSIIILRRSAVITAKICAKIMTLRFVFCWLSVGLQYVKSGNIVLQIIVTTIILSRTLHMAKVW